MADKAPAAASAPKTVEMPRAVHEIVTGPKPENKIAAGTLLTDDILKTHGLDDEAVLDLVDTGAIDQVDVLKG